MHSGGAPPKRKAIGSMLERQAMNVLSLDEASAEQLDAAAEANMVTHMSWVQQRTPGMRVEADDQLTVIDSGLPTDTFNFVCRARLNDDSIGERIARAAAYFHTAQRPFSWWVGPADRPRHLGQALLAAGFAAAESELAMAADLNALNSTELAPRGLRIERVRTAQQMHDFAAINAANWTPPDQAVMRFYERAAPLLLAPDSLLWLYLGYLGEEAVATAELTIGGGVAGLYNICTREAHRRRGIGSALTLRPLLDARAAGLKAAILQAAPDGQGVYARLGFRATGRFTEYQLPAGQAQT
jgi:ribosomal protein S18 acetylase RimI-like enzyme